MKKTRIVKYCLYCGKAFFTKNCLIRKGFAKFCSKKCFHLTRRGIIPQSAFKKGFIPWNKGIKTGLIPKTAWKKGNHISIKTEFKKGAYRERSGYWKGGITSLYKYIHELDEYKNWRKQIFIRDNYTCQECFHKGNILHAHHEKKSFSLLLKEFLQIYSQFSPIDDKETLIRLAINYQPFWDINNGKTLCKECHKLTNSYLRGKK